MRLLDFFRLKVGRSANASASADQAKQRLQVLIAHERTGGSTPDFLPLLQRELLEVIRKYVEVDQDKVQVEFERGDRVSTLEVNVELPPALPRRQLV